jgi:hypothetical protein
MENKEVQPQPPDVASQKVQSECSKPPDITASEHYRFLYTYWMHQDQLGWRRLTVIYAIQAAFFAALLRANQRPEAIALFVATLIAMVFVVILVWLDFQTRNEAEDKMRSMLKVYNKQIEGKYQLSETTYRIRGMLAVSIIVLIFQFVNALLVFCAKNYEPKIAELWFRPAIP